MPEPVIVGGTDAWQTLPDDKREQVTRAAMGEFAARGYAGASMNALVKAAGISKGSLFHYFGTKGHLFEAIVDAAFGEVKTTVKAVRDQTDGQPLDARLEQLLEAGFGFVSDHPRLAAIYFRVLRSGDAPFGQRRLEELGEHSRRFLAELITAAQARGEADPGLDPERTAWLLDAMLERLLAAWHSGAISADQRDEDRRAWVASFRRLVAHGTSPVAKEDDRG